MTVHPDEHLVAVERELDLFTEALGGAPLGQQVPTCPEWTLRDLGVHVGEFTGFWTHVLCEATGAEKPDFPAPPEGDLADWFRADGDLLLATLRTTPPETESWSWDPSDQSAAFARRRSAHELAVHRVDAQCTVGRPQPIDGALAADGIDEIFVMMAAFRPPGPGSLGDGSTLHLHSTDRGDERLITFGADGPVLSHEHAEAAELTVEASTSDLELLLYQRPTLGPMEQHGDLAVLDAWYEAFTFGG